MLFSLPRNNASTHTIRIIAQTDHIEACGIEEGEWELTNSPVVTEFAAKCRLSYSWVTFDKNTLRNCLRVLAEKEFGHPD